jgi:hypothetical protein
MSDKRFSRTLILKWRNREMKTSKFKERLVYFFIPIAVMVITGLYIGLFYIDLFRLDSLTGSGSTMTVERTVGNFNKVSVSDGINLFIEQGSSKTLTIEAEDNLISRIGTRVIFGKLTIGFTGFSFIARSTRPINVYVEAEELKDIELSGEANIKCDDLKTDALEIDITGESTADLAVQCNSLVVDATGGSVIDIEGVTDRQEIELNSWADYNAAGLNSRECFAEVNSGASADVDVSEKLIAEIHSNGVLNYTGSPDITQEISSGGSLNKIED